MADLQLIAQPTVDFDRNDVDANFVADEDRIVSGLLERVLLTPEERSDLLRSARNLKSSETPDGIDYLARDLDLDPLDVCALIRLIGTITRIGEPQAVFDVASECLGSSLSDRPLLSATRSGALQEIAQALRFGGEGRGGPLFRATIGRVTNMLRARLICAPTIEAALSATRPIISAGGQVTYALAGSRTWSLGDADANVAEIMAAIEAITAASDPSTLSHRSGIFSRPAIAVRLSDLHPRFEAFPNERVRDAAADRLRTVAASAAANHIMLLIEWEPESRVDALLSVFETVFSVPDLHGWDGVGVTVSAQSKRALPILRWLRRLAFRQAKRLPVRLVEYGSDWRRDIDSATLDRLSNSPVLSTPEHVALSMMACTRLLLSEPYAFYPILATIDPWQLAAARLTSPGVPRDIEHPWSIGEARAVLAAGNRGSHARRRVYAPVGAGREALGDVIASLTRATPGDVPYLVVTRAAQPASDPVALVAARQPEVSVWTGRDPDPQDVPDHGLALGEQSVVEPLFAELAELLEGGFDAPVLAAVPPRMLGSAQTVERFAPQNCEKRIGSAVLLDREMAAEAVAAGADAFDEWRRQDAEIRIRAIENVVWRLGQRRTDALALMIGEGGMTLRDAVAEFRAGVDALRWIADEARGSISRPPEQHARSFLLHRLEPQGRGLFAVILDSAAGLTGMLAQAASALVTGNAVALLPPPQLPLLGAFVGERFHEAGVPVDTLQVLNMEVATARRIVAMPEISGVAFHGPRLMAETFKRDLIAGGRILTPFLADCGGTHLAIVDASADLDQASMALIEALRFRSGQTSASPKLVIVSEHVADQLAKRLVGMAETLTVGDPLDFSTDIGPLIDQEAADLFLAQKIRLGRSGSVLIDPELPLATACGSFGTPAVFEVEQLSGALALAGPAVAILTVPDEASGQHSCTALRELRPRTVSVFAERRKTVDAVAKTSYYGVLNVNSCGDRWSAYAAHSGADDETVCGAAFGTSGWLSQFMRTAAVTSRLDKLITGT